MSALPIVPQPAAFFCSEVVCRENPLAVSSDRCRCGGSHAAPGDQALFDTASAEMVRAVGAANRQPSPTPPATDDDYQELFNHYRGSIEEWDLASNSAASDPRYCSAVIHLYEAALGLVGSAGQRLRSELAYLITAG
jgi:hypothetical protein